MAGKKRATTRTVNKSAISGRFVSNAAVARWPKQTYRQTVTVSKKGK